MRIPIKLLIRAIFAGWPQKIASLPFQVAGWFIMPFLWKYRAVDLAQMKAEHKWATPWMNPEDWTGGYLNHGPEMECIPKNLREDYHGFWGFYRYHALRNRAHGLRNYDWFAPKLNEGHIEYLTNEYCESYSDWWLWSRGKAVPGKSYWYFASCNGSMDHARLLGFKYVRYFKAFDKLRYYECKFGWRVNPKDALGYNEKSLRWKYGTSATFQPFKIGRAGSDYD